MSRNIQYINKIKENKLNTFLLCHLYVPAAPEMNLEYNLKNCSANTQYLLTPVLGKILLAEHYDP